MTNQYEPQMPKCTHGVHLDSVCDQCAAVSECLAKSGASVYPATIYSSPGTSGPVCPHGQTSCVLCGTGAFEDPDVKREMPKLESKSERMYRIHKELMK